MEHIDWDSVNVIIPELYRMTGTSNRMARDGKSVTLTETLFTQKQLEVCALKDFEKTSKNRRFVEIFKVWFGVEIKRKDIHLIKRDKKETKVRVLDFCGKTFFFKKGL